MPYTYHTPPEPTPRSKSSRGILGLGKRNAHPDPGEMIPTLYGLFGLALVTRHNFKYYVKLWYAFVDGSLHAERGQYDAWRRNQGEQVISNLSWLLASVRRDQRANPPPDFVDQRGLRFLVAAIESLQARFPRDRNDHNIWLEFFTNVFREHVDNNLVEAFSGFGKVQNARESLSSTEVEELIPAIKVFCNTHLADLLDSGTGHDYCDGLLHKGSTPRLASGGHTFIEQSAISRLNDEPTVPMAPRATVQAEKASMRQDPEDSKRARRRGRSTGSSGPSDNQSGGPSPLRKVTSLKSLRKGNNELPEPAPPVPRIPSALEMRANNLVITQTRPHTPTQPANRLGRIRTAARNFLAGPKQGESRGQEGHSA